MREVQLEIQGLGIILYSPQAVAHIGEGADYLSTKFFEPADVAQHVMGCQLTAFCTGSPGLFRVRIFDEVPLEDLVQKSEFKLRLGLQVHDGVVCLRDLYDFLDWSAMCPQSQQLSFSSGWYRLTVASSTPPSGVLGDSQVIDIYFEKVKHKPQLKWVGVPSLY